MNTFKWTKIITCHSSSSMRSSRFCSVKYNGLEKLPTQSFHFMLFLHTPCLILSSVHANVNADLSRQNNTNVKSHHSNYPQTHPLLIESYIKLHHLNDLDQVALELILGMCSRKQEHTLSGTLVPCKKRKPYMKTV